MINSESTVAMSNSVLYFVPPSNLPILTRGIIKTKSLPDIGKEFLKIPSENFSTEDKFAFGNRILNNTPVLYPFSAVAVPNFHGASASFKRYQDAHVATNSLKHTTATQYTNAVEDPNAHLPISTHVDSSHSITSTQALGIINQQIHSSPHSLQSACQSIKLPADSSETDSPSANLQTTTSPKVSKSMTDSLLNPNSAPLKYRPATVSTLVFFDLETTGLAYEIGKSNVQITEVSMIAISRKEFEQSTYDGLQDIRIIQKLCFCTRPRSTVSPGAAAVTGLNNDNLVNQQPFEQNAAELINSFLSHLPKPVCLLAHNGNCFDFPLLKAEFARLSISLSSDILIADTLVAFRTFGVPVLPPERKISQLVKYTKKGQVSYALANLHLYLFNKYPPGSHSSEGDCIALAKVCHQMKDLILPWVDDNFSTFDSISQMW
ncbi:three-prime repair exonuclease 1 [Nephila pilipes]|uniref:Three-prime repair exonuclease 1 n=1 Tax=Nephila pilipes TaxID=299642 RepID=A0A8X6IIX2_NEPPI|nr:three-prime repair exonuclease 1 [Nephila pilipes]